MFYHLYDLNYWTHKASIKNRGSHNIEIQQQNALLINWKVNGNHDIMTKK